MHNGIRRRRRQLGSNIDLATLSVALEHASGVPAYVQLYEQIRELILAGRIVPGARLPSTRALAGELGVSRTTTLAAYDQLTSEGYLDGKVGSGAFVSRDIPEYVLSVSSQITPASGRCAQAFEARPTVSRRAAHHTTTPMTDRRRAFDPGLTDIRDFPVDEWMRLMARSQRMPSNEWLFERNPGGYPPLREAISEYLRTMRGLECSSEQVIVTSGAREAAELLARVLFDPGDTVWMEEPGYPTVRETIGSQGGQVRPIPIDAEGFDLERAQSMFPGARLAFVTPSRQYPIGMPLSLSRRLALIDWASREKAWIVEDDYDSEYRYTGRPIAAMATLDSDGRVIYMGSFSKVMFTGLRLGWLVVPKSITDTFLAVQGVFGTQASTTAQPALSEFIAKGKFGAHIRRMRRLYSARQKHLVAELGRLIGSDLAVEPQDAGMHIVARLSGDLSERMSDRQASERAARNGITAPALSSYYLQGTSESGLVLGYAGIPENEITKGVERLAAALLIE